MTRRKLFWSLAAALPLLAVAAWCAPQLLAEAATAGDPELSQPAKAPAETAAKTFNCCDDPTCPPGCCPECPPDCCPGCQAAPSTKADKTARTRAKANAICPPCPFCP